MAGLLPLLRRVHFIAGVVYSTDIVFCLLQLVYTQVHVQPKHVFRSKEILEAI